MSQTTQATHLQPEALDSGRQVAIHLRHTHTEAASLQSRSASAQLRALGDWHQNLSAAVVQWCF